MFSEVFVCPQGVSVQWGLCPRGRGLCHEDPPYGVRAGSMHPTGMHSCLMDNSAVGNGKIMPHYKGFGYYEHTAKRVISHK